jgi:tetratricopeptide (TPR) repeat protein
VARQYGNLGTIYSTRGDLDTAEEFHRKSLALSEELGRKEGMANQYGNLGLIYLTRGDHDTAEENFRNSLALNVELGRKVGMANDYGNLGQVLRERGDLAEACRLWAKAKRLFEDVGAAPEVAQIQGWMDGHGCGGNAA